MSLAALHIADVTPLRRRRRRGVQWPIVVLAELVAIAVLSYWAVLP